MSAPLAYLDGRFLPQDEARLTLHDAGFVMGVTVTDLCRTFRHEPYRLDDHLARFRASCDAALVPLPIADADLADRARELAAHNARLLHPDDDLAVVFFATPGPVGFYLGEPGGPGDGPPTLGLHTFPLPFARYAPLFEHGASLRIPPVPALPPECIDRRVKQRSRLHWWLADRHVRRTEPGASALLADPDGGLTETGSSNFLVVRDGAVVAPPVGRVLEGVSLRVVEELCGTLGVPFRRERITLTDARAADEAMLACTSYCLAGVRRIEGHAIPWPGPTFRRLLAAWGEQVGVDVAGQIRARR